MLHHPQRPLGSRAFTLIELLVVIAIIAVLAALILAGMGRAKEKAAESKCLARLRSIGVAIQAYASENQTLLPSSGTSSDPSKPVPSPPSSRWPLKLAKYMDIGVPKPGEAGFSADKVYNTDIFSCPVFDGDPAATGAKAVYGLNENLTDEFNPVRQVAISNLSSFPVLGDAGLSGGLTMRTTLGPNPVARDFGWSGQTYASGPSPNHNGRCSFLFGDGHVEARGICTAGEWPWNNPAIFKPQP